MRTEHAVNEGGTGIETWFLADSPLNLDKIGKQVVVGKAWVFGVSLSFESRCFECFPNWAKIAIDCGCRHNSGNVLFGKGFLAKLFGEILKSLKDLLS
jgi:hypothetical protein